MANGTYGFGDKPTLEMEFRDQNKSKKKTKFSTLLQEDIIFTLHVCNKNPIVTSQGDIGRKTNFQGVIVCEKIIFILIPMVLLGSRYIISSSKEATFSNKPFEGEISANWSSIEPILICRKGSSSDICAVGIGNWQKVNVFTN